MSNNSRHNPLDLLRTLVPPELNDTLFNFVDPSPVSTSKISTTVAKSNSRIIVYAEMPGFDKNSIDVDFYNNRLDISGNKPSPVLLADEKVSRTNIKYGQFTEKITLPVSVTDRRNVSMKYSDGVLKIVIDLANEERNRFKINLSDDEKIDRLD